MTPNPRIWSRREFLRFFGAASAVTAAGLYVPARVYSFGAPAVEAPAVEAVQVAYMASSDGAFAHFAARLQGELTDLFFEALRMEPDLHRLSLDLSSAMARLECP